MYEVQVLQSIRLCTKSFFAVSVRGCPVFDGLEVCICRHAGKSAARPELSEAKVSVEMASADLVSGVSALHQASHRGTVEFARSDGCFVGNLGRYIQVCPSA